MSTSVSITELGDGVEEAVLATWLCAVGDSVAAGEPIAEVMTDKVNLEIEAPVAGVVTALHGEPEDTVRIGQVIAEIGDPRMTTTTTTVTETGLWQAMVEARAFDQAMCRHNGHWHEARGEEAVFVGAFADLGPDDVVAPHFRGACAVALQRGSSPATLAAGVFGTDASSSGGHWRGDICPAPGPRSVGMFSGSLGTSVAYATGAALHLSRTGPGAVAVCGFGDGTANSGIVAESLNLAAMLGLPVVYVCQDNQYATSLPSAVALAGERVSDRARALGIPATDVDGNDVLAVRDAIGEAVARARAGAGPSFVHALTYRMGGHYMNDPETYRSPEEVAAWAERDPIARLQEQLVARGELTADDASAQVRAADERMEAIVAAAKGASDAALVRATSPYAEDLRSAS